MAQQQQQHQQQKAKTKTKTTTKTKRINRFLCVPRFLYIWKMKTTITTTVKAAGEAFAELDTIVVVAHVVCTFVVSLQLFVVVLVSLNRIQLSVVVVVLVVVLRISRVLIFSKCKSNYAIQNRKLNLLNWKMSRNFELFWNSLMNLIRKWKWIGAQVALSEWHYSGTPKEANPMRHGKPKALEEGLSS